MPPESMIDVTQSMACIHCGVCVSACLSMEVDPEFIGPAALAKAYRFVGDPRDGEQESATEGPRRGPARHLRLHPLLRLRRGLPQGRGADEPDHAAAPARHRRLRDQGLATTATATRRRSSNIIEKWGTLFEAQLLPRSFGDGSLIKGQLRPQGAKQLTESLPTALRGAALGQGHPAQGARPPEAARPEAGPAHLPRGRVEGRAPRAQPLHRRRDGSEETRMKLALLARLRVPRLHPGAARLDGEGRAAARPRAGRARPRQLLRRRRDRRAQPGAGRHAQRAHVRDGPGRRGRGRHDEHLLDLPGRAVRVPGAARRDAAYRDARSTRTSSPRACPTRPATTGGTRTSSGCWSRRSASTALREQVVRPLAGLRIAPVLRLLHRAPHQAARLRRAPGARPLPRTGDRGARRRAGRVRGRAQVLRLPGHHDEPHDLAAPGRPPRGGRDRRRRRLPRHAVPALPPQPGPAAARGAQATSSATSTCPSCTCRRWSAWRLASSRRSSGWASTSSRPATCSARSRSSRRPEKREADRIGRLSHGRTPVRPGKFCKLLTR